MKITTTRTHLKTSKQEVASQVGLCERQRGKNIYVVGR